MLSLVAQAKNIAPIEASPLSGFSASDRLIVRELIQRDWRPHLNPAERDLISYICAASIERGHAILDCTWVQLSKGVRAIGVSITKWLIPPIGISRATFYRLMSDLVHRGVLILKTSHRKCTNIQINLDWTPESGTMAPKIAISKRKKQEMEDRERGALGSHIETPYIEDIHNSSSLSEKNLRTPTGRVGPTLPVPKKAVSGTVATLPIQARPTPAEPKTTRQLVTEAEQASATRRVNRAKDAVGKDTLAAFRATFAAAWAEGFPGLTVPGWTEKEGHMLRASLKARYPDVTERHKFLAFVTQHWAQIITEKFGWMTRPAPPAPSLRFLTGPRIIPTFMDAYAERARLTARKLASPEEAQVTRLMDQGMTRDEALVKVGERRALSRQTDAGKGASNTFQFAERERAKVNEERKQLMRDKSTADTRRSAPQRPQEGFDELPPIELPPIDPSAWSTPE